MLVKIVTILKLNYLVNYSRLFILIEFKSTLANNIPFVPWKNYDILLCFEVSIRIKIRSSSPKFVIDTRFN